MHSKARLTYTQVAQYFDGATDAIPKDRDVHKSLNTLFQLYQILKIYVLIVMQWNLKPLKLT